MCVLAGTSIFCLVALQFDRYDPEYTHFRSHGAGLVPRILERRLLKRSHFARIIYTVWLNNLGTVYRSQPAAFQSIDPAVALERIERTASTGFERNLDTLIRLARMNGAEVVLFGFV